MQQEGACRSGIERGDRCGLSPEGTPVPLRLFAAAHGLGKPSRPHACLPGESLVLYNSSAVRINTGWIVEYTGKEHLDGLYKAQVHLMPAHAYPVSPRYCTISRRLAYQSDGKYIGDI